MKMRQIRIRLQQLHPAEFARIMIAQLRSVIQIKNDMHMPGQRFARRLNIKLAFHPQMNRQRPIIQSQYQILSPPVKAAEMLSFQRVAKCLNLSADHRRPTHADPFDAAAFD